MFAFNGLKIGADPEVFFTYRNQPKSVEGLIGGTKADPKPMEGLPEGFAVQEDNVAAEFNIPPANSFEEFDLALARGLGYIAKIAKAHKCRLALVSAMHFSQKELATPHAQTLGCDPDYNAWLMIKNPRPNPPESLRTAAGHVHFGWDRPNPEEQANVARAFDIYVVAPSILITEKNERRSLYGKAGACRPKPYGVECRALDNFWIGERKWRRNVWDGCMTTIKQLQLNGGLLVDKLLNYADDIQQAINDHDKEKCGKLMDIFEVAHFNA